MSGEAIQPAARRALRAPLQMGQAGWITVSVMGVEPSWGCGGSRLFHCPVKWGRGSIG